MEDDDFGAVGSARDGWFSRTPGEIDDERRAASARLRPRQREAQQKLGPSYRLDRWGPQHIGLGVGALTGATSVMTDYDREP